MKSIQCQGGTCNSRKQCYHFAAPLRAGETSSPQLCTKGTRDHFEPVSVHAVIRQSEWSKPGSARFLKAAHPFDGLLP